MATIKQSEQDPQLDSELGAALIASGFGAFVLGIMVIWAEKSVTFADKLAWNLKVGPLSGKTGVAVIAFFASWILLHFGFQRRTIPLMTAMIIGGVLLALGLLFTFPPFFELFAAE